MRRHRLLRFAILALVALTGLLSACGDDGGDDSGDGGGDEVTAGDLEGTTWVSTDVTGHDLVEGTEVTLTFEDDRLSMAAGCNTQTAGYEITDSRLTLTTEVAATMMGCPDDLAAQDQWLASFFADGADLTLAGGLIVVSGDVEIELVEQAS